MKVRELLCKCYNCDYRRTIVTIYASNGGWLRSAPTCLSEDVKNMYVRNFKLGPVEDGRLTALEITTEGRDKL
jgi:hypothetical protein|nr:MAG TPA: hypothetical protein [Caudoviricetes sp.]